MRRPPALWLCVVTVGVQVLLLPSGTVAFTSAVNPGFRTILTQKGLNYAEEVLVPLLKEEISDLHIPTIVVDYNVAVIGTIKFTLSNAFLTSLNFGDLSLTSDANGLVLTDYGISVSLSADWSYRQEQWPHFEDSGTVDVSGGGISLKMTVDVTMNKTSGGIHLNCSYCSIGIGDLSVTFHGGLSWLYNLFDSMIEGKLKSYMNDNMCSQLQYGINVPANSALDRLLKVTYVLEDGVEIDYALVANPNFSHPGIVTLDMKGEFRLVKDPQDPPFPPPPFPDPSLRNFSQMIYLQGSSYVAESASWAFWKAGFLSYNVSNDKIPAEFGTTDFYCSIVSPLLCKKYPNKKVMFGVVASDYPRLKITPEYAVVMGKALASMYVKNNGHEEIAFSLNLNVQANVNLSFDSPTTGQYLIRGNVSNPKFSMSLNKTKIGNFNCSTLKNILTTLAPSLGLAYINSLLGAGIPIPVIEGVSFINPSLTFGKGYVEVSGDVKYSPEMLEKLRTGLY
jgi:lipopolysaccharide-binding protein